MIQSEFNTVSGWFGTAMRSRKVMRSHFSLSYAVAVEEQMRWLMDEAEKWYAAEAIADAVLKNHAVPVATFNWMR